MLTSIRANNEGTNMTRLITAAVALLMLTACSDSDWRCVVRGDAMFSMDSSGNIGGAGKGCSCDEMRRFERETFGYVDEDALRSDFGCR